MIFSKEFFNEEKRDGFLVSAMMKRAWAAEIEVLEVISDVCDKLGIKYYAYYGTLLGAIRHGGFVPWDDDIDICMMQDDYYVFLKEAHKYLPNGFVIAGAYADEPRLWNANTSPQARVIADETCFPLPMYMNRFHSFPYMRIGIDIFPVFSFPKDKDMQKELLILVNEMQNTANSLEELREKGELTKLTDKYEKILNEKFDYTDDDTLARSIRLGVDKIAIKYSKYDCDEIYDVLYEISPETDKPFEGIKGYKTEWFGEGIFKKFEEIEVRVPDRYKDVLRVKYGSDYMTPKKFTSGHNYPFYKDQEEAFAKLLRESGITTPVDDFCRGWHMANGGV